MIKESEFIYCPGCGSKFEQKPHNLLLCPSCHLHYYINPKPTTAAILFNQKKDILFVVRKFNPKKGMLDLPGGFVNINETLEMGMLREIEEELQIKLTTKDIRYIGSSVDEYEHGEIESKTINAMYMGNLPKNSAIIPTDDVEDFLFISPNNIPYEKLAFQGMKDFLRDYFHE